MDEAEVDSSWLYRADRTVTASNPAGLDICKSQYWIDARSYLESRSAMVDATQNTMKRRVISVSSFVTCPDPHTDGQRIILSNSCDRSIQYIVILPIDIRYNVTYKTCFSCVLSLLQSGSMSPQSVRPSMCDFHLDFREQMSGVACDYAAGLVGV